MTIAINKQRITTEMMPAFGLNGYPCTVTPDIKFTVVHMRDDGLLYTISLDHGGTPLYVNYVSIEKNSKPL